MRTRSPCGHAHHGKGSPPARSRFGSTPLPARPAGRPDRLAGRHARWEAPRPPPRRKSTSRSPGRRSCRLPSNDRVPAARRPPAGRSGTVASAAWWPGRAVEPPRDRSICERGGPRRDHQRPRDRNRHHSAQEHDGGPGVYATTARGSTSRLQEPPVEQLLCRATCLTCPRTRRPHTGLRGARRSRRSARPADAQRSRCGPRGCGLSRCRVPCAGSRRAHRPPRRRAAQR